MSMQGRLADCSQRAFSAVQGPARPACASRAAPRTCTSALRRRGAGTQGAGQRRPGSMAGPEAAAAAAALPPLPLQPGQPVVKVCGVTSPEDAEAAAAAGARLIGMILWPRAKRSVGADTARAIAAAARRHGAEPVGVFVDEDAAAIQRVCREADVRIAQLHGDGARAALPDLPAELAVIYVLHADKSGAVQTALPVGGSRQPHWLIVDSLQGGSGESFDWRQLREQAAASLRPHSSHGWLLAGGLTPETVAEAISVARPTGVDVSSGVCRPDGLRKDAGKVEAYCRGALAAFAASGAAAEAAAGQAAAE